MAHEAAAHAEHEVHPDSYYIKIWALLLVLLAVSIIGPMFGHQTVTLITAFGIAVVKACIVCAFFMHLSNEKSLVSYLLIISLLLVALMFSGVATDVLKSEGNNWENVSPPPVLPVLHHEGAHHADAVSNGHHGEQEDNIPATHH